jgi:hypothetical protein
MSENIFSNERHPGASLPLLAVQGNDMQGDILRTARQTLNHCVRGLDMLSSSTEDEFLLIAETLRDISTRMDGISASETSIAPHIEDIVTLIQFHDITRQHFEKSSKSCRIMIEQLSLADNKNCSDAVRRERDSSASAEDLARFCACEAVTVEDTREQFVSAVMSLIKRLEAIAEEVGQKEETELAAEIKKAVQGIRIHSFADAVSREVLSNLGRICESVRPSVSPETWERITADSCTATSRIEHPTAGVVTGNSRDPIDDLGDNVEFF